VTLFQRLSAALRAQTPVALVTRIDEITPGAKLVVDAGESFGNLGTDGLNYAAAEEARALLSSGETTIRTFGADGEPVGSEARLFIQVFAPHPRMYIFGAIDFSRAMARMGKMLGYTVTVVDARAVFATKIRLPDADEVVVAWPDEFLQSAPVDERTAIVVLTHDPKFDVPLLVLAVRSVAGYIGAMGSRGTQAERLEMLREAGLTEAELARISAPIGLDIGARTPEETAVSIAAEIIAMRSGRSGRRLRDGTGPVHGRAT